MSESSYYDAWIADGKPFRLATPIKEVADKVKKALPGVSPALIIGTIGDLDHLLALPPQDHTPYSQTGWPVRHPYPVVNAIDLMHKPHLGLDCNTVFPHWLAAAKAGHLPWLKYLIWQAKRYDVRNNWVPVASSGHYDHMHASGRSDTTASSIGGWHPLPGHGGEEMLVLVKAQNDTRVYLADGLTRRWIETEADLADVRFLASTGQIAPLAKGGVVQAVANLDAYGIEIGVPASVHLSDADRIAIADLVGEDVVARVLPVLNLDLLASKVADLIAARLAQ